MTNRILLPLLLLLLTGPAAAQMADPPPYAWLLIECVHGHPAVTGPQPLGSDQVGVSSWCYRGPGSRSPMYGGNFGVHFETLGPVVGAEIDVNNHAGDAGPAAYGEHVGLWLNRSGASASTALRVSSQGPNAWHYGIHFDPGAGGIGTAALIDTVGIYCNGCMRDTFEEARPMDDADGDWWTLLDARGHDVKATIRKRGAFGARGDSTGPRAPAFYFIEEQTGMYQPAPAQIGFSLAGTEAFKITPETLVYRGKAGLTTTVPCAGGGVLTFTGGLLTEKSGC